MARKHKIWRFQRSSSDGDVVSAMTHDRHNVLHFPIDDSWLLNFGERFTFYATAMVVGTALQPRLRVIRETTVENWK